jgi:hypothetical protein
VEKELEEGIAITKEGLLPSWQFSFKKLTSSPVNKIRKYYGEKLAL